MTKEEIKQNKIKVNSILIGKEVYVITDGGWYGMVKKVIDEEMVLIALEDKLMEISIFDIRNV